MGGIFGVASKKELRYGFVFRGGLSFPSGDEKRGMTVHGPEGFNKAIHNIENSPFRTKFESDVDEMEESGHWLYLRQ